MNTTKIEPDHLRDHDGKCVCGAGWVGDTITHRDGCAYLAQDEPFILPGLVVDDECKAEAIFFGMIVRRDFASSGSRAITWEWIERNAPSLIVRNGCTCEGCLS